MTLHFPLKVPVEEPDGVSYNYDSDCDSDVGSSDKEKTSRGTATNLIVSQTAPFQMTEDVWGYVNITKENEGNEKHPVKAEEFQITLYSESLNADQLRVVLADWVKEYESRLNKDRDQHLKVSDQSEHSIRALDQSDHSIGAL